VPFVFVGVLLRPVPAARSLSRRLVAVDVLVTIGAVTAATWALVLQPMFATDGTSLLGQLVAAAYPIGDAAIICCLALVLLRERQLSRPTFLLLAVARPAVAVL